jgi:hypothetical protein
VRPRENVGFVQFAAAAQRQALGMTNHNSPDLFTNVHKGLRSALFSACTALGTAVGDAKLEAAARSQLAEVLRFVAHHGDNEDTLLLPLLSERAPGVSTALQRAHAELDEQSAELQNERPCEELYRAACAFTARYLQHLDEEERVFEPQIRAALSAEEIQAFGRRAVERTQPSEQRMMLGWMLPAMARSEAEALLARLPAPLAAELCTVLAAP